MIPHTETNPSTDPSTGRSNDRAGGPPDAGIPIPRVYESVLEKADVDMDAVKVIRRLTKNGFDAYLVGGGVRDLLLRRVPKDFDLATSARPEQVRRLFRNCRVIGRRFRLAHVMFGPDKVIEVATFRRDPNADEDSDEDSDLLIRRDNVFGEPHEDAIRRDFTINGLFYDRASDSVIDYVGGVEDLRRRLVKTIGDPDVRLREDPVRILRAIKFSARLDLGIDPDLYRAMVAHRGDLARSAKPRLLEEIFRLLRGGAAHRSTFLLWDLGSLGVLIPELSAYLDDEGEEHDLLWGRLKAIDELTAKGERPTDAVMFAALMLGPLEEWLAGVRDPSRAFEEFMGPVVQRLAVPRRLKDRTRSIVVAQRRLNTGKLASLPRRDFFPEAAQLFAIDRQARGEEVPDWAVDVEIDPNAISSEPKGRSRRRRRRR